MKDYHNVPIKRQVQNFLYSDLGITGNTVIGLAGNNPTGYSELLMDHFNPDKIILLDKRDDIEYLEHDQLQIVRGDIRSRTYISNIMDCDFCASIKYDVEHLRNILDDMRKLHGPKMISFTCSLRVPGGLKYTVDTINTVLFDNTLKVEENIQNILTMKAKPKQFGCSRKAESSLFDKVKFVTYHDSHSMLQVVMTWDTDQAA